LGSKKMQGFLSAMQDSSKPLALIGLRGITTLKNNNRKCKILKSLK
jgi:hypothetical protein